MSDAERAKKMAKAAGPCTPQELAQAALLLIQLLNNLVDNGLKYGGPAGVEILAHPECPPDVVAEADFTGSTKGIVDWVHAHKPAHAMLVTECSMASNIADELPEVEFAKPCNLCPHMKLITLEKVLYALHSMTGEVLIAPEVAGKARQAVQRMIDLSRAAG